MRPLLEILKKTTAFLEGRGLENPRLEAELLLAAALHCKRLDLYLQFERPLDEERLTHLRDWVRRRAAREPLQYITGETSFRQITLKCDARALIPRPETEELIAHILASPPPENAHIADLGTGTGAIALALAHEKPTYTLTATDISSDALALAHENAHRLSLETRVKFAQGSWLDALAPQEKYDIITSNPPYLTETELATAQHEVAQHEPHLALFAPENGLSALKTILTQAKTKLRPNGFVALETGIAHAQPLITHAKAVGYEYHKAIKDLQGHQRFFFAWVKSPSPNGNTP
ncbi:MAG: peptide chain release factor N(5)-glutamine methyltransferase [Puniceicoccales bacterium]|jgi:release factor glutamine methyltransferase|nr:peptide chain release factor N(5)-glutamine methyltransferase [Puniceicoccales bacterium]